MEAQNKNPIIDKLERIQFQLLGVEDEQLPIIADVIKNVYEEQLLEEYGHRDLVLHSLSSFIVDTELNKQQIFQFPELLHLGEVIGVDFSYTVYGARTLYLEVDAEAVAVPPADKTGFDPFFKKVNVPIDSLTNIVAA